MRKKYQHLKERYLTVTELAHRWRVDKFWVYRNLDLLGIPTLRFGRSIRFAMSDVLEWEKRNSQVKR